MSSLESPPPLLTPVNRDLANIVSVSDSEKLGGDSSILSNPTPSESDPNTEFRKK